MPYGVLRTSTDQPRTGNRRWVSLAVLCLAVILIVMDGSIVNVALPTLARKLAGATNSRLQWIVDSYILAFAALLLTAGSAADRFGRKRVLLLGLIIFAGVSMGAAASRTCEWLITWRALMGVGAAMIFPSTLAMITEDFPDHAQRRTAIAIWAGTSGLGVAIGPIAGGWLLEHWHWGAVFLINVPVAAAAFIGALWVCRESKSAQDRGFDLTGCVLAITGVFSLVWGLIEAPEHGWASLRTAAALAGAAVVIALFIWWERRHPCPMLDVRGFADRTYAGACLALAVAFFGLFGFVFMVTQFFQFLRGYDALSAGLRTAPFAGAILVGALSAAVLGRHANQRALFTLGLVLMSAAFAWATIDSTQTPYTTMMAQMGVLGIGLGLVNAGATEAIMSHLPAHKAGTGSSVNDTLREVGGTLGVAAMGSAYNAMYRSRIGDLLAGAPLPADAKVLIRSSIGAAHGVITRVAEVAGPQAAETIRNPVHGAFLDGFRASCWLACACVIAGAAVVAWVLRPTAANNAAKPLSAVQ